MAEATAGVDPGQDVLFNAQPAVKTAIIGCGVISEVYLKNAPRFPVLDIVACADLIPERAAARAEEFGLAKHGTVEEVLADPEIEMIVNLTIPAAHYQVALAALESGKSVYNEKPLTLDLEQGRQLLAEAERRGLLVGCAPDTFLGAGLQTCRELIDRGAIGTPVAATAFMLSHGPEHWHPDPAFFYQVGGGPMFDIGPYYLTALVSMLGPVRRVSGSARISYPERVITSKPKYGQVMHVEVPTHVTGVLDFASGAIGTIITSFDLWAREMRLEIYGSEGTIFAPDPNTFGPPVRLRQPDGTEEEISVGTAFTDNSRGLGVADLAQALRDGHRPRASGEMAFHVLEIMHAIHESSTTGRHVELTSTCPLPEPLLEVGQRL